MATSADLRRHILSEHPESMTPERKRRNGDSDDVEELEGKYDDDDDSEDSEDSEDSDNEKIERHNRIIKKKLNKQFVCVYGSCNRSFTEVNILNKFYTILF
jgi:hypothetical protein